jgi:hypothetical protein
VHRTTQEEEPTGYPKPPHQGLLAVKAELSNCQANTQAEYARVHRTTQEEEPTGYPKPPHQGLLAVKAALSN